MTNTKLDEQLLTVKQSMAYMKCSQVFIWKLRRDKKIHAVNAGKKILLVKASLDSYLNLNPNEAQHG